MTNPNGKKESPITVDTDESEVEIVPETPPASQAASTATPSRQSRTAEVTPTQRRRPLTTSCSTPSSTPRTPLSSQTSSLYTPSRQSRPAEATPTSRRRPLTSSRSSPSSTPLSSQTSLSSSSRPSRTSEITPTPHRRPLTSSRSIPPSTPQTPRSNRVTKAQYRPPPPPSFTTTPTPTPTRTASRSASCLSLEEGDYLDDDELPAFLKSFRESTPSSSPSSSQPCLSFRGDSTPTSSQSSPSSTPLSRSRAPDVRRRLYIQKSKSTPTLPPPRPTVRSLLTTKIPGDKTIKINDCVELIDGTFLRIVRIEQCNGQINLKGHHLKRFKDMGGLVPKRINELLWIEEVTVPERATASRSHTSASLSSNLKTIPLNQVLLPRALILTNQQYLAPKRQSGQTKDHLREHGLLYCRFKYTRLLSDDRKGRVLEEFIESLDQSQCDDGFFCARRDLSEQWRGEPPSGRRRTTYTFGDAFCGAGGVTRGAQQAGLKVRWGFDKDPDAMVSWRANFQAIGETAEFDHFLTLDSESKKVDVLHASPPCQTFSPAHTNSQNISRDEDNEACITCLDVLLLHCRPRISTLEETFGLTMRSHQEFLKSLVYTYVKFGFSVRWGLSHCVDYGVPQTRKRLVMIGAAPGEILPQFPPPTHGDCPDLKPKIFVEDAIKNIPPTVGNHDPEVSSSSSTRRPWDGRSSLAPTLKCSGTEVWHPSGSRPFTVRELACLQTFPLDHFFVSGVSKAKRQIGNAVPPRLAKAVFKEIIKTLRQTDERIEA
ncbi:hypothetical protein KEM56_002281 [Ascosphaera pollenicola]|nr:hypothetical protein KEM56_002281 [Ascosphaera pollenicola]